MADLFKQFKQHAADLLKAEQNRRSISTLGPTPLALVYPNHYAVGMASLGYQTVYRLFNETPIFSCERAFLYEGSFASLSYTLESLRSLSSFRVVAFSLAYELDYFQVLKMLELSGIPLQAERRSHFDPLIIFGGVTMFYNPEVMAPVADVIFLGEAESLIPIFARHYEQEGSKEELLRALAQEPGFYIPSLHQGATLSVQHLDPANVEPATSFCIPQEAHLKMFMIEVGRGCGRGCRFCSAGHVYHPFRTWPVQQILATVDKYAQPGDRIGLVGAALSDYRDLDLLCTQLLNKGYLISLSSLRMDRISEPLLNALQISGIDTITLAPESGSERLRRVIGKNLSEEQIYSAVDKLAHADIRTIKLYYMIGLPTETDDDVEAIITLTEQIALRLPHKNIRVGLSTFIPKPCTPFQWAGVAHEKEIKEKWKKLSHALYRIPYVSVSTMNLREDMVQAMLSLGDRELGRRLIQMEQRSVEQFRKQDQIWIHREKELATPFPWDSINCGISKERLWASRLNALQNHGVEQSKS